MKKSIFLITLTSILILTAFTLTSKNQKVVIIDIGHGGKDTGASAEQVLEKEVNLQLANKIKALNTGQELKLLFTRNGDEFRSIEERVAFSEKHKADALISIHANYADTSKIGVELYYGRKNNSDKLAAHFKDHLSKRYKINKVGSAGFKVLNDVSCPAIMIEAGFLSNRKDRERLTSEEKQTALAKAILAGLQ